MGSLRIRPIGVPRRFVHDGVLSLSLTAERDRCFIICSTGRGAFGPENSFRRWKPFFGPKFRHFAKIKLHGLVRIGNYAAMDEAFDQEVEGLLNDASLASNGPPSKEISTNLLHAEELRMNEILQSFVQED